MLYYNRKKEKGKYTLPDYVTVRCKNCGGTVSPLPGNPRFFRCDYCANVQSQMTDRESYMIEKGFDALRRADFDEAEETFSQIIMRSSDAYEAYWGRALARFGITFVDDYRENKRVPTIHKVSPASFVKDTDYSRAIAHAPREIAIGYRDFAAYIEKIRNAQMLVAQKEKPYDIFLCYKESDEERRLERTRDSYDCSDLYVHLTGLGYRVFFSRESLRGYISEEFEPYIYNALATAKVMIVYGTRPEYMKSTWVKNEWSRYQKMIDAGRKQPNSLVVAASQMPLSQVPDALKSRQCMDADFRTFYTDLDKHIAKVIAVHNASSARPVPPAQRISSTRFCSHCGAAVAGVSRFCPRCGRESRIIDPFDHTPAAAAVRPRVPPVQKPPQNTQKPAGKKGSGGNVMGVIAFVMAIVFLVLSNAIENMPFTARLTLSLFIAGLSIGGIIFASSTKTNKGIAIAALIISVVSVITAISTL